MTEAAVEHYMEEYSRQESALPDWMHEIRESAIDSFRAKGFPTRRHEDWKYTDIRPIVKRNFVTARPDKLDLQQVDAERYSFGESNCYELVFINGSFTHSRSNITEGEAVAIIPMAEALKNGSSHIRNLFDKVIEKDKNAFDALNSAFIADGAYIYLPDNTSLEKPVHLLFLGSRQPQPRVSNIRNMVILGENSRATIIETYAGVEDAEYFTNTVTECSSGRGAVLEHYKLQQESLKGFHVGSLRASLKKNSRLVSHSISLGGSLVRNNIDADLVEEGAGIIMNGLYIAGGKQHVDNHTSVNHRVPHTSSQENYRGVLNGHARGVFNGRVVVHKQAQKTDAHQSNANLLLSNDAEVDTKPELEIYADDVKCSHGATIGQLDENMLFYLRSRAIDEETARSLLTFAFAEDVVNRIRFEPVRERLELSVLGKLPDTESIKDFIK